MEDNIASCILENPTRRENIDQMLGVLRCQLVHIRITRACICADLVQWGGKVCKSAIEVMPYISLMWQKATSTAMVFRRRKHKYATIVAQKAKDASEARFQAARKDSGRIKLPPLPGMAALQSQVIRIIANSA